MQTAALRKMIRDRAGRPHAPGEIVQLTGGPRRRSSFDDRRIVPIRFADGTPDDLFEDELNPASTLP